MQDVCRRVLRIALRHDQHGLEGITEMAEEWPYTQPGDQVSAWASIPRPLALRSMGRTVYVEGYPSMSIDPHLSRFEPIDAHPQVHHTFGREVRSLGDFAHFATMPKVMTEPVVLPEPDVDQLLSMILEKQQAAKTAYFKDLVAREGQPLPPHRFHAQIISLKAA